MVEFSADGGCPLSRFVNCLDSQQNQFIEALEPGPIDRLTVSELFEEFARSDYLVLFQAAYHAERSAPLEKLTAAVEAHKALLRAAFDLPQGETTRPDFLEKWGEAKAANSQLLPYLKPPKVAQSGVESCALKGMEGAQSSRAANLESLLGDEAGEIFKIAKSAESCSERMRKICAIDRRFLAWNSPKWAEALGVSNSAIRQSSFWTRERPKATEAMRDLSE